MNAKTLFTLQVLIVVTRQSLEGYEASFFGMTKDIEISNKQKNKFTYIDCNKENTG